MAIQDEINNYCKHFGNFYNGIPFLSYNVQDDEKYIPAIIDEIKKSATLMRISAGKYFTPDTSRFFYYVQSGHLRLEYIEKNGFLRPLLVYTNGAILHLACALFNHDALGTFLALDECAIWRIPADILKSQDGFKYYPCLASASIRILSSIMLTYYGALTFLESSTFRIRFCRYLLLLARRFGSSQFSVGISQDQCAATLGVHRATLARVIKELKSDGILEYFNKDGVYILDINRLRDAAKL